MDKVEKEKVEGMEMIVYIDDVVFMLEGESVEVRKDRVGRMEVGLKRALEIWEVDVQVMKVERMWMVRDGRVWEEGLRWLGEDMKIKLCVSVLGVWLENNESWRAHMKNRMECANKRWRLMVKLVGRGGRGMSVKEMKRIWKMVVGQSRMYGMELYWDEQEEMRKMLQVWLNRGMRRMLGVERCTPVDAMLSELEERGVEYELRRKVERWGIRLRRRGKGESYGDIWKRLEEEGGVYVGGWVGRMKRGVKRHKIEGERWEVEVERVEVLEWKVICSENKEVVKGKWEESRKERERGWLMGGCDAGESCGRMGIGGGL